MDGHDSTWTKCDWRGRNHAIGKEVEYAQGILLMGNFWFDNLSENKSLELCLDGFIEKFREIKIQTIKMFSYIFLHF
jgi:hypothetical protein